MDRIRDDPDRAPKINDLCDPRESRKPVTVKSPYPRFFGSQPFFVYRKPLKIKIESPESRVSRVGGHHFDYSNSSIAAVQAGLVPDTLLELVGL